MKRRQEVINYRTIKQLAREQSVHVGDLCALSPQNDPFYVGQKAQIKGAEWFARLWDDLGFKQGAHLRRIHYALVSQSPPVMKPGEKPYVNTEGDWDYLNSASKWVRYLGLVSPKAFVDRRNPEAIICAHFNQRTDEVPGFRIEGGWNDWECNIALPDLPDLPGDLPELCDFTVTGYKDIQQGFLTEVWVEKTTMNDVLDPLCRRYGANLITGAGELSITAVVDFLKRARQASRPARILYISDFDPAGLGMPISVARKIEFEQRTTSDGDIDIRLHPIALTAGQVKKYHLPRVPVKETDRRKVHFEAAYGPGAVELDALEALHPGELGRLVEGAILRHYDPTLEERALKVRGALQASLQRARAAVLARYQPDLDSLRDDYRTLLDDYEKMQSEFAELVQRFQPRLNFYKERLAHIQERGRALNTLIAKRLGDVEVDLNDYSLPAPDLPKEAKSLLYDSRREYLKQLAAYKARRDGAAG